MVSQTEQFCNIILQLFYVSRCCCSNSHNDVPPGGSVERINSNTHRPRSLSLFLMLDKTIYYTI